MKKTMTRRDALRTAAAGAAALLPAGIAHAQAADAIRVAGKPVDVTITSVSPHTVRIQIRALENGQPQNVPGDGALVKDDWGPPALHTATLAARRSVACGDLKVTLSPG